MSDQSQSQQIQLRQARSMEEDYLKMLHFLQELEELVSEGTDEEIIAHLQKGFDENVGRHYERLIWGYDVLIRNCCDETLTYLDWKPEIKAAMEQSASKTAEIEKLRSALSNLFSHVTMIGITEGFPIEVEPDPEYPAFDIKAALIEAAAALGQDDQELRSYFPEMFTKPQKLAPVELRCMYCGAPYSGPEPCCDAAQAQQDCWAEERTDSDAEE